MKPVNAEQRHILRTPAPTAELRGPRTADCPQAHIMTEVVLVALTAAILALYAAMFVGLYRWGRYAPLLPPESAIAAESVSELLPPDASDAGPKRAGRRRYEIGRGPAPFSPRRRVLDVKY
jgi:hypothetical protein